METIRRFFRKIFSRVSPLFTSSRIAATATISVLGLFAVLVAIGVHGSSIGVFAEDPVFSRKSPGYSYPSIGKYRKVRSDEWNVSTLQVISQCESDQFFPRINKKIAGGADMFMSTPCNPVWDWTAIGQFHNWGYFLFGAERGMAWNWLCRYLGVFLFAFLFFRKRLRDELLSFTAAVAVTLGSPTVWWDTTIPFMLLYFFAALCGLRLVFQSGTTVAKIGGGLLAAVSLVSFCFCGYPIFELLLLPGLLILAFSEITPGPPAVAGQKSPGNRKAPWIILLVVLMIVVAEFIYFFIVHAEALRAIKGSCYPGSRVFQGGNLASFLHTRSLDVWSLLSPFCPERYFPGHLASNYCTMARYFVPGCAIFACLILARPRTRHKRSEMMILGFGLLLVGWGMRRWPVGLAKATGFYLFSPARSDVIAGFFLLLFTFFLFAGQLKDRKRVKLPAAIIISAVSILPFVVSMFIPSKFDLFFKSPVAFMALLVAISLVWMISFGMMRANRSVFCCGYMIASLLPGLVVHPWSIGISPVRDTVFAKKVLELDKENPGRWLANRDLTGNVIAATGVDCIPGTMAYAYPRLWGLLDPGKKYINGWNRYGSTYVHLNDGTNFTAFANGSTSFRYNLTEKEIRALGIRHLVWGWEKIREPWAKYEGRVHLQFFYTVLPEEEVPSRPNPETGKR